VPSLLLFAWRKALTDSGLRPPVRHTALVLSTYMDMDGEGARPAIDTLACDTGYHADTVRRHLRHLESSGWLLVEPSKGGRHRTNRWRAHIPHHAKPVDNHPEKPPHQRGGRKRNPRASVDKPPRPRGGISYDHTRRNAYQQQHVIPAQDPSCAQPTLETAA
jgi:hypothetical protein